VSIKQLTEINTPVTDTIMWHLH